jgi:hypothetical protein
MGKKCIPGVICIENMTLFLLIVIVVFVGYFYYKTVLPQATTATPGSATPGSTAYPVIMIQQPLGNNGSSIPVLNGQDASLTPPVNGMYMAPNQLPTLKVGPRSTGSTGSYTQVGILTRTVKKNGEDLILPLMGRRTGRYDKMQYYTMSNTGPMNTKLPVSRNGKSCTGEYGCDEIMNGDTVYVEGYSDTFKSTVYESGQFSYDPVVNM